MQQQRTHKSAETPSKKQVTDTGVEMARFETQTVTPANAIQLQRVIGNHAMRHMLQRDLPAVAEGSTRADPSKKKFEDFDAKQYRVSGSEPNRKIEEVKRTENEDGQIEYMAMGVVVGFSGNKPVVDYYAEPLSLGDWFPRVTHVNGMNVKPESGMRDALSLQLHINSELEKAGDDVAVAQDAIDVLYTYSATLSFLPDVWDCLKGKLQVDDTVIDLQKQTMLDAVHTKQRVSVSAHSRGTIKTDNAVRNAHAALTEELIPIIESEVGGDIVSRNKAKLAKAIREIAQVRAKEEMDTYIHLIYAGNAVEFPSTVLPIDFLVGSRDAISLLVGTYTKTGVKDHALVPGGNDRSTMKKLSGHGHSYSGYAPSVAEIIGKDILKAR